MINFKNGRFSCGAFEIGIACESGSAPAVPLTISRLVDMSAGSWIDPVVAEMETSGEDSNVWIFIDDPDRPLPRVVAALAAARKLAEQGKRVTILDGDDHQAHLGTWAGREQTEGWIDIVRYGTSLPVSSIVLPVGEGRIRLASVGSYRPTRLSAYEAGELISKLTIHTDYVMIVASSGDSCALWASLDGVAFVCREKDTLDTADTKAIFKDLASHKIAPKAVLVFEPMSRTGTRTAETARTVVPRRKTGSSPVFRIAAVVLILVIAGLGSWWMGLLAGDDAETQPVAARTEIRPADAQPTGPGDLSSAVDASIPGEDGGPREDAPAGTDASGDAAGPADGDGPEAGTIEAPAPADIWRMDVGASGYCLHVFSCANEDESDRQVAFMTDRGVRAHVHAADVNGQTWYRIYAGSFETVAAARAAMPELFGKLDTDWAAPVPFEGLSR